MIFLRSKYLRLAIKDLMSFLLRNMEGELLRKMGLNVCQFCREFVLGTASTLDDAIVLPIVERVERALGE